MKTKKNVGLVLEGLEINREFEDLRETVPTYESVGGMDDVEYTFFLDEYFGQGIDEAKVITFNGKMYPKFNNALVLSGGSGSGKSFIRKNKIALDGKIIDVDRLKELYVAAAKFGKFDDKRQYDFKNPKDVGDLHQIVKQKGFKDTLEKSFYDANHGDRKPNIIYDITGDDPDKLKSIGKKLKDMGYTVTLVWVVTNREEAYIRNLKRDRVVPEEIFHKTHNDVARALDSFLKSADAKYYDAAWIAFGSGDSARALSKEEQDELDKMGVIRLEKAGSSFTIPDEVEDRVNQILGPMEPNPKNPENYVHYEDFLKDIDGNVDGTRAGKIRIRTDL